MKCFFNKTVLVAIACLIIYSCKKDEIQARINTGAAPTLATSVTSLVLNQANANDTAVRFTWNKADYGFNDAINYSLQISKAGTNFASASTTELTLNAKDLRKAITVRDLNRELLKILPHSVPSQVQVRMKSDVGNIFSNVVNMTITPYRDLIIFSYPQAISVAGNFQNWSPETAPKIVSLKNDGKFDGFIDFTHATPEFKFVKGNAWSAGDYGSAGTDKLGNGGPNLTITTGAGTYLIRANTTDLTWTNYKINSWGLIGDAIAGTGWNSDRDLIYDAATKTWKITLDLIGGKAIKFRANDDWGVNMGDDGNDGKPEFNGANIPIAISGNYTITFDVSVAGNYFYSIKKN